MTRERVAGRELDAEVGRALGLPIGECRQIYWPQPDGVGAIVRSNGRTPYRRIPEYSSDISSALQVVEAMREKGWTVEITAHTEGDATCGIEANRGEVNEHYVALVTAATAPLAICLAALDAMEGR